MPIDPHLLDQVLRTAPDRDVTESPIVRVIILGNAANAADLVSAMEIPETAKAYNARRILCLFNADAVPYILTALGVAGPNARKEGLEVMWALLSGEEDWTLRKTLTEVKQDLDVLLEDKTPWPDTMPEYIERDFHGRICDLAYIIVRLLADPEYDQSQFRSFDESARDQEIVRFKARGTGLNIV